MTDARATPCPFWLDATKHSTPVSSDGTRRAVHAKDCPVCVPSVSMDEFIGSAVPGHPA